MSEPNDRGDLPPDTERPQPVAPEPEVPTDVEATINLTGDQLASIPVRDDLADLEPALSSLDESPTSEPPPVETIGPEALDTASEPATDPPLDEDHDADAESAQLGLLTERPAAVSDVARVHLKGLLEALVFVSDRPIKPAELAKAASASGKEVRELLAELKTEYEARGICLDEVAGGFQFRTNAQFAPFVRDLTKQKPVRLSRAQVETLAILAYRQPITRPEIDEIRGVDSGATLKLLLERDIVRILGKKDEPGRPLLYGTTPQFLEFFGLKSLKDLPTLKEFTELNEDSRRVVERELGDVLETHQPEPEGGAAAAGPDEGSGAEDSVTAKELEPGSDLARDTLPPEAHAATEDTIEGGVLAEEADTSKEALPDDADEVLPEQEEEDAATDDGAGLTKGSWERDPDGEEDAGEAAQDDEAAEHEDAGAHEGHDHGGALPEDPEKDG